MEDTEELETLAMAVHGALALGHLIGALYNARRGNWKSMWVHIGALAFDAWSVYLHWKGRKECAKRSSPSS